jgi:hypothetical protein
MKTKKKRSTWPATSGAIKGPRMQPANRELDPAVAERLVERLSARPGSSVKRSSERVFVKRLGKSLCTVGRENGHLLIDFKPTPGERKHADASSFVAPHPVSALHQAGWRQARVFLWREASRLLRWMGFRP